MATQTESSLIQIAPAQIWVGNHLVLQEKVISYLQKLFCKHNACSVCIACKNIREHNFHGTLWIKPDRMYTVEHLKPIFSTITLARNTGESFFFILDKVDYMASVCANRLLKVIEEPPPGYHFIMLAQRPDLILPTIRSRSLVHSFHEKGNEKQHPLLKFFLSKRADPITFLRALDLSRITETETQELLDQLLETSNKNTNKIVIDHVIKTLEKPVMPGSSKIVLRNLFLQIHSA